jgi:cytochrome c oxidase subunit 1
LIGGFGNLLLPLMLCSSDMIFPRLNALSVWLLLDSFYLLLLGMFLDGGCNAGWTIYVPLSIQNYSSVDFLFFSLHFSGLSSLLGSINFIVSLIKGCNLSILYSSFFLPLFPWSIFFTSLLLIVCLPVLAACITMIIYDRHYNSSFFDPLRGGDLLLFQHLFWFFGHPEVYILILPSFGIISEILCKYIQCFIFGRDSMLIALLIIGMIGCIVWGHHMFIVGFDIDTRSYFTSATSIIAIPTGIKILNWFATLWSGCFFLISSIFFIIGFLLSFSFGGFTGIILANCCIDILLHDCYFVVGHFHYVLSLGAIYSSFAAFYNYLLFFSSYSFFNEFVGRIHFSFFFNSSNLLFFSMHSLGIFGFPRRIFDYSLIFFRYHWMNYFGTVGIVLSLLCFILVLSFLVPAASVISSKVVSFNFS